MKEHEEVFVSASVDQQIEQLAQSAQETNSWAGDDKQPPFSNITLVETLQHFYADEPDRISLERVKQRLIDKHSIPLYTEKPRRTALDTPRHQEVSSLPGRPVRHKTTGITRTLSVIAAVLIMGLLVGSWVAVTRLARHPSTTGIPITYVTDNVYFGASGAVYKLNGGTGSIIWQHRITTPGTLQVKVANGMVYALQNQNVYALNTHSGNIIWHKTASAQDTYAVMQIANDTVYIYGEFHTRLTFMALNAHDGTLRWLSTTVSTGGGELFTVQHGAIYVEDDNQAGTYALDATTGILRWHAHETHNFGVFYTMAMNGVVYDVAGNRLYALDEKSGHQLWMQQVPRSSDVFAIPRIANGVLYISSYTLQQNPGTDYGAYAFIHAFDAKAGTPLWTSAPGYQLSENVPVSDGLLIAEYRLNGVYTFNTLAAKDGKIRWQFTDKCPQASCTGSAMVSGETLYLFVDKFDSKAVRGTFTAFDLHSGKKLYQHAIPSLYAYNSDVDHGIVYFMISTINDPNQKDLQINYSIYAIQLSTGVTLWQHAFDKQGESTYQINPFVAP